MAVFFLNQILFSFSSDKDIYIYIWMDLNPASFRWSLRVVDSGNPGHLVVEKELDSLVKVENSHAVPVVAS